MNASSSIAVLSLASDLDVTTVAATRSTIDELIDGGCRRIILKLDDVTYIDSAGMSLILTELRRMRAKGGLLSLTGVSNDVYKMLTTLRLVDLMPVRKLESGAVTQSFDSAAPPLRRTSLVVDPGHLGDARHRVVALLKDLPLSDDELFDLELAAGEALGNAVDHSCAEGIAATVSVYRNYVMLEVEDCGCGITLDSLPQEPLTDASERGRGIKLMQLLMDSVSIGLRPQGTGTLVRLIKRLNV